jgi:hypothetical protein
MRERVKKLALLTSAFSSVASPYGSFHLSISNRWFFPAQTTTLVALHPMVRTDHSEYQISTMTTTFSASYPIVWNRNGAISFTYRTSHLSLPSPAMFSCFPRGITPAAWNKLVSRRRRHSSKTARHRVTTPRAEIMTSCDGSPTTRAVYLITSYTHSGSSWQIGQVGISLVSPS